MAKQLLDELNAFRVAEGKDAFKDWRKVRHMPMLEKYRANAEFEMPAEELAAQDGRPVYEELEVVVIDSLTKFAEVRAELSTTENEISKAAHSHDFAGNTELQERARELAKTKSYKQVARYDRSAVDKPVNFVWQFLSDNPGMTRKEAVIALTEGYGVNYSTARTQYQRWFAAQKEGKK